MKVGAISPDTYSVGILDAYDVGSRTFSQAEAWGQGTAHAGLLAVRLGLYRGVVPAETLEWRHNQSVLNKVRPVHVLPHLPARQWVLSVPKRLRPYLHHDMRVAGAVLRIFLRAIRTTLRSKSPGAPRGAQLGAVSFFHRFGSSLNVHPHYHLVVLDGVFS